MKTIDEILPQARKEVSQAAASVGVTLRELTGIADYQAVCRLVGAAFHVDDHHFVNPAVLNQLVVAGGHLVGGFRGRELTGVAIGFLGRFRERPSMHSLLAAVAPELQRAGLGYALKLAQRNWALTRRLDIITWTFDTLSARNAYFNIGKLGAALTGYLVDPIGALPPPMVHARSKSDMGVVCWRLCQPLPPSFAPAPLHGGGNPPARVLLDIDDRGRPVIGSGHTGRLLCRIPDDIGWLRREDPSLAKDWQRAIRQVLAPALARGFEARTFLRPGTYVLTPPPRSAPAGDSGV